MLGGTYTFFVHPNLCFPISRVIALPSVKYSGRVETDVLGVARWLASQPFAKITIDPEPCMTMLLEKLQKATGFCELAISVCSILSRMSHGCYG